MVRQRPIVYGTERIEHHELAHPGDALIHMPGEHQAVGITVNHERIRGVQAQRFLERFAGASKVTRPHPCPAERGVTDGGLVIRLDRLQRGGPPFFHGVPGIGKTLHRLHRVR